MGWPPGLDKCDLLLYGPKIQYSAGRRVPVLVAGCGTGTGSTGTRSSTGITPTTYGTTVPVQCSHTVVWVLCATAVRLQHTLEYYL